MQSAMNNAVCRAALLNYNAPDSELCYEFESTREKQFLLAKYSSSYTCTVQYSLNSCIQYTVQ